MATPDKRLVTEANLPELVQDLVAAMVALGGGNVSAVYDDATGKLNLTATIAAATAPPTYSGTQWRAGAETVPGLISPSALAYTANRPILAGPPAAGTVPTAWEYWDSILELPQKLRSKNPDVWIDPNGPRGTRLIPIEQGQNPPTTIGPDEAYVVLDPLP